MKKTPKVYTEKDIINGFKFRCNNKESHIVSEIDLDNTYCKITRLETGSSSISYEIRLIVKNLNDEWNPWIEIKDNSMYKIFN